MLRRPGHPTLDPRAQPIGAYAAQPALPMTPRVALTDQLHESLAGPPGVRLSLSTDRQRTYWGTDAVPAPAYPTGPKKVNRQMHLETAPYTAMRPRGL